MGCPGGYEFGAKPNLITWVAEIIFECAQPLYKAYIFYAKKKYILF
jgi:hypothetical protein